MEGFKKRNGIVFKAICGESNAVDVNKSESLQEEDENLETGPEDWNLAISNDNNQQPTFQDFINVDDGLIASGELNESDIVHALLVFFIGK
ncbi:unnamed protein product [Parnassius apollo]|uniref:(apollo) hypothetical protein n=1 Tax=Parnassius apollo TaxID=110799 RepID=A0A8S3XHM8_PARAO|nr:unnamed protein product [Parnassius apollo]